MNGEDEKWMRLALQEAKTPGKKAKFRLGRSCVIHRERCYPPP
jgi:hypothetical protein